MKNNIFKSTAVRAAVAIAVGLMLLIWPSFMAKSLVQIVGAIILLAGIIMIIKYVRTKTKKSLVYGVIGAAIGLFLLFFPSLVAKALFAVFAILVILFAVERIIKLVKAERKWKAFILPAAMIILGVLIFFQPATSVKLVVILFGAALLLYGASEVISICTAKQIAAQEVDADSKVETATPTEAEAQAAEKQD